MADFQYQQPQRFRITNKQRDEEKKRKSGSSGGIPDRWLDYLGVNTWIENTRFIAFKCPLKPEMQKHLNDDRRFTLADLVERLDDVGKELGFIVDLTNTDRYYKATDIADAQIQYYKLMTPGHHQIPSEDCYQKFVKAVGQFLEENKNNDKLIGVHCTHGLNRTGYLIVRYMIEQMNFEPSEALEAFNRARGHSMEKYTEDLLRRKSLSSANTQSNISSSNSTSSAAIVNNVNGDQIQWPTMYSTLENLSLNERRPPKLQQQRSQPTPDIYDDQTTSLPGHGRTYSQQNPSKNNFYRQTSVAPRILTSASNEDQRLNQTQPAYFGSGSNVGRGRPMTGDR